MKSVPRFRFTLWAAATLLGFLAVAGDLRGLETSAGPADVRLLQAVHVSGPDIQLQDIADVFCPDPQLAQRLGRLTISKAPLPGQRRHLRKNYVALRLRQFGFDSDQVALTGAPATVVTARSMEVEAEEIRRIVSEFVHAANLWGSADVTITDIQLGSDRLFPPGRLTHRVVPSQGPKQSGILRLSILFEVDGWYRKSIPAVVRIDVLNDVVVARRPIGRYKPITEKDVTVQRLDLTNLPAHIFTDTGEVIGKRARRKIQAKSVLRHDMIETPPLVHRGSMVSIVAESGGLKVTTLGEVKSSGYLGQRVKVVNLDSKKTIFARVVDENTVQVEF